VGGELGESFFKSHLRMFGTAYMLTRGGLKLYNETKQVISGVSWIIVLNYLRKDPT